MNNIRNIILGFCEIIDGMIRILSIGFIHTRFAFIWLVWWEKNVIIRNHIRNIHKDVNNES